MEKRVLLAIFLAFLVLYVWQAVFVKPLPKPVAGQAAATSAAVKPPAGQPSEALPGAITAPSKPAARTASPVVGDRAERDIRVETREVIAVFTNRGARLKSWRLKRYLDQARQPQELVENQLTAQPLPFTLRVPDE